MWGHTKGLLIETSKRFNLMSIQYVVLEFDPIIETHVSYVHGPFTSMDAAYDFIDHKKATDRKCRAMDRKYKHTILRPVN